MLRSLLKDMNEQISGGSLKTISKELSYKHVSIKDEQYFTFDKFGIRYDRKTIKELYEVRNALFYGGDFDFAKLFKRTVQLFDLLDRTILTMLGWKGKAYVSKEYHHGEGEVHFLKPQDKDTKFIISRPLISLI
jgi:hypothetical protein